jgi:type VI secretion system VgrG family protein
MEAHGMPTAPDDPAGSAARAVGAAARPVAALLGAPLDSDTRLYRLDAADALAGLQVEAFVLEEALSQPWRLELVALHPRADLDLDALLAQPATLVTVLADGTEHRRSGQVLQALAEDSDGGFARYRLVLQPWLGFLSQTLRSRVWQERHLTAIVEEVLGEHAAHGGWRWSPCVATLLEHAADGGRRSYCVQYRESDLDFVARLLAEEGIAYRFEEAAPRQPGPIVVFFADSTTADGCPEDAASASPLGGAGILLQRDGIQEEQDTIQAFGSVRGQLVAILRAASYDYKTGRIVAADVPTVGTVGGPQALRLEAYDSTQGYAWRDAAQAERALRLRQQALEVRHERWTGRGGVRSFEAGATFALGGSVHDPLGPTDPHDPPGAPGNRRFLLTRLTHVGINNLPKEAGGIVARTSPAGRRSARLQAAQDDVLPPRIDEALRRQAAASGHANRFEAVRADLPWRPLLADGTGARSGARARATGPLTATVVGPEGGTRPHGAQELHCDALGRVRIRYAFQDGGLDGAADGAGSASSSSTWVRVQQPFAGEGVGMRWIPRIGHEVLVRFFDDDIERPYVACSLYNGRGEGGDAPTPGGAVAPDASRSGYASAYARSSDAAPGAQGNLVGGQGPAWHGGSAAGLERGGQRNAAALSGYKTREFGGTGFNQLVFDDSPAQLRAQLATTQHASQLSLGHLVHQADNHRGSFRGRGFELRTDAYGAVRGARGVLLTTYGAGSAAEPAGDNAAGIALARQWDALARFGDGAAKIHRTIRFSGIVGTDAMRRSGSDPANAPIPAWLTQARGMVAAQDFGSAQADAGDRAVAAQPGKVPHGGAAVVSLSARAGLAMTAGHDLVFASLENVQLGSGEDLDVAVGGAMRMHTQQAIGILGGAAQPAGAGAQDGTAAGTGLTLIAGAGDMELQAQAGMLQVAARDDLRIQSQGGQVDWASAKKITLSTAGGAGLVIEGGSVTFMGPGTITVRSATKSFVGPAKADQNLPLLPKSALHIGMYYRFSI